MYCPVTYMKMPPNEGKAANLKAHPPPLFWERQWLFLVESELLQNLKFVALTQKRETQRLYVFKMISIVKSKVIQNAYNIYYSVKKSTK